MKITSQTAHVMNFMQRALHKLEKSISVSPKELPSSQYRENLSASPRHSSSNIEKQSEAPRFVPASMLQEVT